MRSPYVFQIGFDFGTSYSKCVYRDLSIGKSFVYENEKDEFLISSSIIYENDNFFINYKNYQYPEHGLWHIKMAIVDLVQKEYTSPTLSIFNKAAKLTPGSLKQSDFVKACGLFYLSRTLHKIRCSILKKYPDFGEHDQDDMYITMAIPVRNIENKEIKLIFLDLLKKSWNIACQNVFLSEKASSDEMKVVLKNPIPDLEICNVYPEVSANIQAFQNSSMFPGRSTRIYLVTDVGAGTVDQCSFTCYQPDNCPETNNYLSAQILGFGSGLIEHECVQKWGRTVDEWRQCKELGKIDQMSEILGDIRDRLAKKVSSSTLLQLKQNLPYGAGSVTVTPEDQIRDNVYLIFSGGGVIDNPYRQSIIQALEDIGHPKEGWEARIIHIPFPSDIELPHKNWMNRLYVAYGLSFLYENLSTIKFPSEIKVPKVKQVDDVCPYCRGKNPQCFHCDGYG